MPTQLTLIKTVPVLRSFDEAKAREFYVDFLGFTVDWEHRFEPGMPLYMQVSRAGIEFHISEHHGSGSPGAHVRELHAGSAPRSISTTALVLSGRNGVAPR